VAWRRFELNGKFWEIHVDGVGFATRYGDLGTRGLRKTKEYRDRATALAAADRLIALRRRRGYLEVQFGGTLDEAR
jgi:predicted DNA-binding WGR domain protein